jgi:hypothetical protein
VKNIDVDNYNIVPFSAGYCNMELYLYMYLIYNHIKRNKIYTYITIGAGGRRARFFAALRMTTGRGNVSMAPLLKGAVSLKADWRIHPR